MVLVVLASNDGWVSVVAEFAHVFNDQVLKYCMIGYGAVVMLTVKDHSGLVE